MSRMRHSKPLQLLGLLSSLWLVLAGCGGQSGSDGSGRGGDSAPRVRHITLQLTRSTEVVSTARHQGIASAQVRLQPGEPGFIERLDIQVQTPQGADLLSPQPFPLGPADQEEVALNVAIPDPPPAQFQLLVSAFNNFNNQQTKIFLGQVLIQRGQESATLTLVRNPDRNTLIPVPATPGNLQQTVFTFTNGAVFGFGLGETPATLTAGSFQGNTGDFTLASGAFTSGGQVTVGSCVFVVAVSTFPPGQGPQVGDRITFDPCEVDAIDGRLTATNASLGISATSEAPVAAVPTDAIILPFPLPTLVIDEDTGGTVQISAAIAGPRPGGITSAITESPAHGTAVLDTTGLLTYRPAADFNGSDRLVVTITVTFTDGNNPPVLLGTLPIAITVRPINDPPRITNPGNQSTLEGATVSLQMSASDVDGDTLTFSATGFPPGLSINATTGLISGTVAVGAAAGSPYSVTATVSDGTASTSVSFTWTVTGGNRPPVPTASPNTITTLANTPGTSQVAPNDPDTGQTHAFAITTAPAHGTATVNATGLVTYTSTAGFTGSDSLIVTVTDNGTPPLAGTVPISITVANRPPAPTAPPITTAPGTPGTSQVAPNDPDTGQTHTFAITTAPAHGAATVNASGLATYTPTSGFTGADSLIVTVTDNGTPPLAGTVPISITVANRPPAPTAPPITTAQNTPGTSQVAPNDPDTGQSHTFAITTAPAHGTAMVNATGLVTYTPATNFTGSDSLRVTVTDNGTPPQSGTVTIPITVTPPPGITVSIGSPATPVASGETFTVPVRFAAGSTNILSYLFQLRFDASVVRVVDIAGLPPFETVVTNNAAFTSGLVKFAANNATFAPAHGVFDVANITLQVVGNAGTTSVLQLAFTPTPGGTSVLVNDALQPIAPGNVVFNDGLVTVSGE